MIRVPGMMFGRRLKINLFVTHCPRLKQNPFSSKKINIFKELGMYIF